MEKAVPHQVANPPYTRDDKFLVPCRDCGCKGSGSCGRLIDTRDGSVWPDTDTRQRAKGPQWPDRPEDPRLPRRFPSRRPVPTPTHYIVEVSQSLTRAADNRDRIGFLQQLEWAPVSESMKARKDDYYYHRPLYGVGERLAEQLKPKVYTSAQLDNVVPHLAARPSKKRKDDPSLPDIKGEAVFSFEGPVFSFNCLDFSRELPDLPPRTPLRPVPEGVNITKCKPASAIASRRGPTRIECEAKCLKFDHKRRIPLWRWIANKEQRSWLNLAATLGGSDEDEGHVSILEQVPRQQDQFFWTMRHQASVFATRHYYEPSRRGELRRRISSHGPKRRRYDVGMLYAAGMTMERIAETLCEGIGTIRQDISWIRSKLGRQNFYLGVAKSEIIILRSRLNLHNNHIANTNNKLQIIK